MPRLSELLNATATIATPSMTLRVSNGAESVREHLFALTFADLIGEMSVVHDDSMTLDAEAGMWRPGGDDMPNAPMVHETIEELLEELFSDDDDSDAGPPTADGGIEPGPWVLRMVVRREMYMAVRDDEELYDALMRSPELDKFARTLKNTVRRGGPDIAWMGAGIQPLFTRLASQKRRLPWNVYVSSGCQVIHIRGLRGVERDVLWSAVPAVKLTHIRGIEGVRACRLNPVMPARADGLHDYDIQTDGSVLGQALVMPELEHHWPQLLTNDIQETRRVLGVEAARAALLLECGKVLECDSNYVSARHLLVLVDMMTLDGEVSTIGRTGVVKGITRPLGAATFEESADILYKAAGCRNVDDLQGPSQRVICGMRGLYGTGAMRLQLDEEPLQPVPRADPPVHPPDPTPMDWAPASPRTFADQQVGDVWAPASPAIMSAA